MWMNVLLKKMNVTKIATTMLDLIIVPAILALNSTMTDYTVMVIKQVHSIACGEDMHTML